jgi:hypothetical protein
MTNWNVYSNCLFLLVTFVFFWPVNFQGVEICILCFSKLHQILYCVFVCLFVCLMVFNATFNNISVISWRSVLLVVETGERGENRRPDKIYHIMLYTSHWSRFELKTSVVIVTDCIDSCKFNYHTITATTTPACFIEINSWNRKRHKISNLILQFSTRVFVKVKKNITIFHVKYFNFYFSWRNIFLLIERK